MLHVSCCTFVLLLGNGRETLRCTGLLHRTLDRTFQGFDRSFVGVFDRTFWGPSPISGYRLEMPSSQGSVQAVIHFKRGKGKVSASGCQRIVSLHCQTGNCIVSQLRVQCRRVAVGASLFFKGKLKSRKMCRAQSQPPPPLHFKFPSPPLFIWHIIW